MALHHEQEALFPRLHAIFLPYATKQRNAIYGNGTNDYARFVHYTSAEAALSIIKTKRVWMRNTTCMSDYREVQHGFEILNRFFSDATKLERFSLAINACYANAAEDFMKLSALGLSYGLPRLPIEPMRP